MEFTRLGALNSLAIQRQPLGIGHRGPVRPPLLQRGLVVEHLVLQLDLDISMFVSLPLLQLLPRQSDLSLRVLHVQRYVVHLGHDVGESVAQPQRPPLHLLAARAQPFDLLLQRLHPAKCAISIQVQ